MRRTVAVGSVLVAGVAASSCGRSYGVADDQERPVASDASAADGSVVSDTADGVVEAGPPAPDASASGPPTFLTDANQAFTTSSTPTLAYATPTDANCLFVVWGIRDGDVDIVTSGVTYAGVPMTLAAEGESNSGSSTTDYVSIWYLVNPPVGAIHDIVGGVASGAPFVSWLSAISARGVNALHAKAVDADAVAGATAKGVLADAGVPSLLIGGATINSSSTVAWADDRSNDWKVRYQVSAAISFSSATAVQQAPGETVATATFSNASRPATVFARFR